ncbi:MAG: hypothetical protein ABFD92_07280 [Planctomycetaceae bacterium]|nr:hypothetical protein [Planctomycetaceae bacterium]
MNRTWVLILSLAVAAAGCDKARKEGSKAVDTGLSSVAEGTEKTVQRFKDKFDKQAADWLKQTTWNVERVSQTGTETVEVHAVIRSTAGEKIDLASILSRDLVMLTSSDGVSHKVTTPRSGEIIIQPGTAIRQKITFNVVGQGPMKELTLVGCAPVAIPAMTAAPASAPATRTN